LVETAISAAPPYAIYQSNDSPADVQVGLGIFLSELPDKDTRLSIYDGGWPEIAYEMAEAVAEGGPP
jgi:hypothetical protein